MLLFWEAVEGFSEAERALLWRFVSGSTRRAQVSPAEQAAPTLSSPEAVLPIQGDGSAGSNERGDYEWGDESDDEGKAKQAPLPAI